MPALWQKRRPRKARAVSLGSAMGFGLGVLRLAPDAFWRMTPRELAAAMEAVFGPSDAPLDRGGLNAARALSRRMKTLAALQ